MILPTNSLLTKILRLGIFAILLLLYSPILFGQIQNDFLNNNISRIQLKEYLNQKNTLFHSPIQPYEFLDSSYSSTEDSIFVPAKIKVRIHKKGRNFSLNIEPILGLQVKRSSLNSPLFNHISITSQYFMGLTLRTGYRKKLHLRTSLFGGVGIYNNKVLLGTKSDFVPEIGYKNSTKNGYSISNYNAALTYTPNSIFAFQVGRGKHKFGDGYQSLLLSERAINYPYVKIRTRIWNLEYVNLYSALRSHELKDLNHVGLNNYKQKYSTSHILSWNIDRKFNAYIFESIIWQGNDSLSQRGFDINYLNPIIFYRPVEFAIGSADNALIGAGGSWKNKNKLQVYAQFVIDEMIFTQFIHHTGWWANKYGAQLGFKAYNPFNTKDTYLQMEWNQIRPFTYSHGSPTQNYAHYNQPLAHPAGSNFYDITLIFAKNINRFNVELKSNFLLHGYDTIDSLGVIQNLGSDIFQSYVDPFINYGNVVGQGRTINTYTNQLNIAYVFNQKSDGRIYAIVNHSHNIADDHTYQSYFFQFGMVMNFVSY